MVDEGSALLSVELLRGATLARTLVAHFAAPAGGIPLLAVFDRPKTVALTWRKNGDVTEWSPIFAGVVLDLGLGIEVCWPYTPNKKGRSKIWSAGSKVVSSKQRRFLDEEDLRTQLAAWLLEVSATRPSRATGVIPAVRLVPDRARLHPLKVALSSSLITRGESSHTMLAGGSRLETRTDAAKASVAKLPGARPMRPVERATDRD